MANEAQEVAETPNEDDHLGNEILTVSNKLSTLTAAACNNIYLQNLVKELKTKVCTQKKIIRNLESRYKRLKRRMKRLLNSKKI